MALVLHRDTCVDSRFGTYNGIRLRRDDDSPDDHRGERGRFDPPDVQLSGRGPQTETLVLRGDEPERKEELSVQPALRKLPRASVLLLRADSFTPVISATLALASGV